MKMNILICCEFFYPSVGGAQKVCEELAYNFLKRGHKVTVATSRFNKKLKKNEIKKNIKIKRFEIRGNLIRGIKGEKKSYQNFLLKNKFDIVFIYAAQQWTFDLIFPIIDQIEAELFFAPCGFSKLNSTFYKSYYLKLPKILKKFKVNILHSENYIDTMFFKRNKIQNKVFIPNAADLPSKKLVTQHKHSSSEIFKITNISNIRPAKGQDIAMLVYFFSNLKQKSKLIIYGNNTGSKIYYCYLKILKFLIEFFYSNKSVDFVKNENRKNTISQFYHSDIFLFTSRLECSPLVLFESASAGLPFLSTNVGNAREIANWTNCGYVESNFFNLIKRLNKMIKNKKLLENMSIQGRKNIIRYYNWNIISEKYLKVFQKYKS